MTKLIITSLVLTFSAITAHAGDKSYCASFAVADAASKAKSDGLKPIQNIKPNVFVVGEIEEGIIFRIEMYHATNEGEVADNFLRYLVVSAPAQDGQCNSVIVSDLSTGK